MLSNVLCLRWSGFSEFRELLMLHGGIKCIDTQKFQDSFTFKKMIRVLEKICGKALWPFLTEKSTVRLSGVHLEGGRTKTLARKEK